MSGVSEDVKRDILDLSGLKEGTFPVKYLGVPLLARKPNVSNARVLIDRITSKIRGWAARGLSYAGRTVLVKSVLYGMYSYWARIFLLPKDVIFKISSICRNYLWGGTEEYRKTPTIAWKTMCTPEKNGGIGLLNLIHWNMALMARQYTHLSSGESLWRDRMKERYYPNSEWTLFQPKVWHSTLCKDLTHLKIALSRVPSAQPTVKETYDAITGPLVTVPWFEFVWGKVTLPRQSFFLWQLCHRRIPSLMRLARFIPIHTQCRLCLEHDEDDDHIFLGCPAHKQARN